MNIQYDNFCPDCTAAYVTCQELKQCPECGCKDIESKPYVRCGACHRVVYLVENQDNYCKCGRCYSIPEGK